MNQILEALDYLADLGRRIREASIRVKDSKFQDRISPMQEQTETPVYAQDQDEC